MPWVPSPSICGFAWGNMFSSISFKYQAVVSQEIPVLLECFNLKGEEVSLVEASFVQNAAEQRQLHAKGCLVFLFFLWLCSSGVCSSANPSMKWGAWVGFLCHPVSLPYQSCKLSCFTEAAEFSVLENPLLEETCSSWALISSTSQVICKQASDYTLGIVFLDIWKLLPTATGGCTCL